MNLEKNMRNILGHPIFAAAVNKLSQKCNLLKLLGDTFDNFQRFCLISNNTCMLSNEQSFSF